MTRCFVCKKLIWPWQDERLETYFEPGIVELWFQPSDPAPAVLVHKACKLWHNKQRDGSRAYRESIAARMFNDAGLGYPE